MKRSRGHRAWHADCRAGSSHDTCMAATATPARTHFVPHEHIRK
ncbi:hypothetical protein RR42_m2176 [Cupriavidus basilensis]|uniref:Uncharacterized protein n=1 Tax=Cupriavidus basilensis TaxID=68895 RepID=A0A0C4Y9F9_9BURK|nr:hypothetical protein RR42_m2176 [Cupriavidus basilensis]